MEQDDPGPEVLEFPSILVGKKLLLGTESLGPVNGVSRTTSSLLDYLRTHGVHVSIAAASSPGQSTHTLPDGTSEIRLTGYPVPMSPDLSVVYPLRLDRLFARTFRSAPDLIYLASPASLGFQILLQTRLLRSPIPVLCNFQTDLSAYCDIMFPAPLGAWAVWSFRVVQGYLFSTASVKTIFYPSLPVRRYIEAAGVPPHKLVHLRRGVRTDVFAPAMRDGAYHDALAPTPGSVVLLSVARVALEKGYDFLAQAAHRLAERGVPFHLVIVGANRNPAVEAEVRALFATSALGPARVTFTGQLAGAALARAYASSDVFLHSSVTETFGLVVLEAMASGLPVVARDEGGPSEIVAHGTTGFLVPPADLDGFVDRVAELARDPHLRLRMARAGRAEAESATWEKINNKVARHLAAALAEAESPALAELQQRRLLRGSAARLRIVFAVALTTVVWAGLVVTWGLVLLGQGLRTGANRVPFTPWVTSELRKWRAQRLRERGKALGHGVRERRL